MKTYKVKCIVEAEILKGKNLIPVTLEEVIEIESWSRESAIVRAGQQAFYNVQMRPDTRFVRVTDTRLLVGIKK